MYDQGSEIEQMIMQENDPKQRAFLIVLNSINNSLIANTDTIREVSDKLESHLANFEEHTRSEEALMNRGRGAWQIATWVIGVAQVIGLGIWQQAKSDLADINAALQKEQVQTVKLETRVGTVEENVRSLSRGAK